MVEGKPRGPVTAFAGCMLGTLRSYGSYGFRSAILAFQGFKSKGSPPWSCWNHPGLRNGMLSAMYRENLQLGLW